MQADTDDILHQKEVRFATQQDLADPDKNLQGGRKSNQNKGKKSYGNLGSAAKFIGDEETKTEAQDKIQYVRRADGSKNQKERAKIKYNFKDFIAHYQNLSEQCVFLV